jgi:hypothetical protein
VSKPLLLGEAPSRTGDKFHMFPLSGAVAEKILTLSDIPPQEEGTRYGKWTWALYDLFDCKNVFTRYYQATPWVKPLARMLAAERTMDSLVIVCLGRKVQDAVLGGADEGFHVWSERAVSQEYPLQQVVTVPHPSGLNRVLNDPIQRALFGGTIREALTRAGNPATI